MKQATKHLLLCLLTCLIIPGAFSSLGAQSGIQYYFEEGNQAYRNKAYEKALEHYRTILKSGFESAEVYYNIGNCYYKLDHLGDAILHYERALRLAPNDREIRENLRIANQGVIDRIEMPPRFFLFDWWHKLLTYFSISQLTILVAAFYLVFMTLLGIFIFFRDHPLVRRLTWMMGISAALTIFAAYLLVVNVRMDRSAPEGIVLAESVNVLSEPDDNGRDLFLLHEGVKVTLSDQRGNWVKISLPDGKTGWVRRENVGLI